MLSAANSRACTHHCHQCRVQRSHRILYTGRPSNSEIADQTPVISLRQAFFVYRLYTFSHKKALAVICSFFVTTQLLSTLMVRISTVATKNCHFSHGNGSSYPRYSSRYAPIRPSRCR
ncbi:hypothetical protein PISMIDRAFT_534343 [Pisolithus microcarpus 441]|uniref:Uncharacterized protein n=1 Tax=Pisolithus microcarpus 441 TaxID=765257 RepID=A0A0C9ZQ33_9AGAM|nr:hypothetical protein PISMIDRAFT_534343 [Pisolithus microcarpus 441]